MDVPLSRHAPLLLVATLAALALAACGEREQVRTSADVDTAAPADAATPAGADSLSIADVGLQTPESVLYDADADVYLVSNIDGDPVAHDGNGFISRLRPDGSVETLKWVDGGAGATLNAPKGMALKGDTLFVADIDTIRAFDRTSGQALGAIGVPGATFLNDLAVGGDGTLYATDSGLKEGLQPSGSDAVYRVRDARAEAIARGDSLHHPNGIIVTSDGVLMVPFGGNAVYRIRQGAPPTTVTTLPAGQLDGIVRMPDGTLLVSSWEAGAVYRVPPDTAAAPSVAVSGVTSPADIGWDSRRGRLLVPLFNENRVEVRTVR